MEGDDGWWWRPVEGDGGPWSVAAGGRRQVCGSGVCRPSGPGSAAAGAPPGWCRVVTPAGRDVRRDVRRDAVTP